MPEKYKVIYSVIDSDEAKVDDVGEKIIFCDSFRKAEAEQRNWCKQRGFRFLGITDGRTMRS